MLKTTTCRFPTRCAETGRPIKKGDLMLYDSDDKKCFHQDSKEMQQFLEAGWDDDEYERRWDHIMR